MDIGGPTNIQHVTHVTFDRFNGFLGLPSEFEPDVPKKAPSASGRVVLELSRCFSTAEKEENERLTMDIGGPTNIQHVTHVTFDRFNGFLGLPSEFEPDVPKKAPSAREKGERFRVRKSLAKLPVLRSSSWVPFIGEVCVLIGCHVSSSDCADTFLATCRLLIVPTLCLLRVKSLLTDGDLCRVASKSPAEEPRVVVGSDEECPEKGVLIVGIGVDLVGVSGSLVVGTVAFEVDPSAAAFA
ncbi:hypothetical protein F2Q69_00063670 [Brassica cretica]|uniref:CRIB domain-containing protein n=1 Tax=Brassica cretica TaxID=69181 RepID=A0A8S9RHQ5_BRACR|nr:hypothetical protein F2Q69_00063670 [Brassica cretica]